MNTEQYDAVCKNQFDQINEKLDRIHSRLFVDNGSPCVQTRLDRNERMWKIACWIIGLICAANIAKATNDIWNIQEHVRAEQSTNQQE